jgi:predicted metal-dependent phosphoesterase TrpH
MLLKASLHIHTKEDVVDGKIISYSVFELIDYALNSGFDVLAITTHRECIINESHIKYATARQMVLLPGIELDIVRRLVFHQDIILICPDLSSAEEAKHLREYDDLKKFKQKYPNVFLLAAHPNFGRFDSMGWRNLQKNIDLFDAVELSWFYSKNFNLNKKSLDIAQKYKKPIIATSDAHSLDFFDSDYCEIKTSEKSPAEIIKSLKKGRIINHSRPKRLIDLVRIFGKMKLKDIIYLNF